MPRTDWIDTWRERDDNILYVARQDFALQLENANPTYQEHQTWMDELVMRSGVAFTSSSRIAAWSATEVLGGESPDGAVGCNWTHAMHGDFGGQLWNGGGGAGDTSPGVCEPLESTTNSPEAESVAVSSYDGGPPSGGFVARISEAHINLAARGIYIAPLKTQLPPWGVLDSPDDPVGDGVPAAFADIAVVVWEDTYVDLTKVEVTADRSAGDAGAGSVTDIGVTAALRDVLHPAYSPTTDLYGTWPSGLPGDWDLSRDGYIKSTNTGLWDFQEITGLLTGPTGWEGLADPTTDDPDEIAILGFDNAWANTIPDNEGWNGTGFVDLGLRFTLRAQRYRWEWGTFGTNPRRVIGRQSPARVYPIDRAQGNGARVIGGYL